METCILKKIPPIEQQGAFPDGRAAQKGNHGAMDFAALNNQIPLPDEAARAACKARWDAVAKPLGSLGLLETAVQRIAALTGSADVSLAKRTLLVLCADNGVVCEGVTQADSSVTRHVAQSLAAGTSSVCRMAAVARCSVVPVDMGMLAPVAGVLNRRVRAGTGDIAKGPAMTRAQAEKAIQAGIDLAQAQKEAGAQIVATGEMGIGNTTTSAAVAGVLLGVDPAAEAGRGAGLSDAGLARKRAALRRAVTINRPDPNDPLGVLAAVGGLDLAGLCGVFLGCALARVPVVVDGCISATAALAAVRLCPRAGAAMLASHLPDEPMGAPLLRALGLKPPLHAGMRLGEGTGAVSLLPLLDMALAVYHTAGSFGDIGVAPYTPQEGSSCTRS